MVLDLINAPIQLTVGPGFLLVISAPIQLMGNPGFNYFTNPADGWSWIPAFY